MIHRRWITSGITEELDARQERALHLVLDKIRYYYRELHRTTNAYSHPLSLKTLMNLTNRSSYAVINAVRILANTSTPKQPEPPIFYDRISSEHNPSHRPYRIFLRRR